MLKGIPPVISPELIKILMEMGHGDELVMADGNFPSVSSAQRLVCADGLGCPVLLDAIPQVFPLDQHVQKPVTLMSVVLGATYKPVIWEEYRRIIKEYKRTFTDVEYVEGFASYEHSQQAFAVLASSEMALYANIVLKKGVIMA